MNRYATEALGRIEWVNLEGQYGFLRELEGDRRILIHFTCLRAAGIQKVFTNGILHCQVLRRPQGWQAYRIVDVFRLH